MRLSVRLFSTLIAVIGVGIPTAPVVLAQGGVTGRWQAQPTPAGATWTAVSHVLPALQRDAATKMDAMLTN